jgi:hydroxymethylpyrimidine pyrophosphatase-like HAD family hydrolase
VNKLIPSVIALDLDGTSARYEPRFELDPEIRSVLAEFRAINPGLRWVLNSDRFEGEMIRLAEYLEPDERPEAILSCQHLIYLRQGDAYVPHDAWNDRHRNLHGQLWRDIYPRFHGWQQRIRKEFPVHELFVCDRYFAFRVPPKRLPALRKHVRDLLNPWPDAGISGNHEWVFVNHRRFSKGALLKEYAQLISVDAAEILAIGDGYNDLSMLDRRVAAHLGCPSDAASEVRRSVGDAGGIVADKPGPAGTAAIIREYCQNASAIK